MNKIILLIIITIITCNKKQELIIPKMDLLKNKDESKFFVSNNNFETISKKIFDFNTKFCDLDLKNKKMNISGNSESGYVISENNPSEGVSYNLSQNLTEKNYILNTNCCPNDVCRFSKVFEISENKIVLTSEIEGEVIYYDNEFFKIYDESITGLIYVFKKENKDLISIYENHKILIPKLNQSRTLTVIEKKEINLFKKPNLPNQDNLHKRIYLNNKTQIYILDEEENFYFVLFKSDDKSIENVLKVFENEGEKFIPKIQTINDKVKNKKEFNLMLEKYYIQFGWIEKKSVE